MVRLGLSIPYGLVFGGFSLLLGNGLSFSVVGITAITQDPNSSCLLSQGPNSSAEGVARRCELVTAASRLCAPRASMSNGRGQDACSHDAVNDGLREVHCEV